MNWKKIFLFDLGRLVPGRKAPEGDEDRVPELWFVSLFQFLAGRGRTRRVRVAPLDEQDYTPARYYRWLGRRWTGPFYLTAGAWRRDPAGAWRRWTSGGATA